MINSEGRLSKATPRRFPKAGRAAARFNRTLTIWRPCLSRSEAAPCSVAVGMLSISRSRACARSAPDGLMQVFTGGRVRRRAYMTRNVSRLALATAAGLACLFVGDDWSLQSGLITPAQARVGQP